MEFAAFDIATLDDVANLRSLFYSNFSVLGKHSTVNGWMIASFSKSKSGAHLVRTNEISTSAANYHFSYEIFMAMSSHPAAALSGPSDSSRVSLSVMRCQFLRLMMNKFFATLHGVGIFEWR